MQTSVWNAYTQLGHTGAGEPIDLFFFFPDRKRPVSFVERCFASKLCGCNFMASTIPKNLSDLLKKQKAHCLRILEELNEHGEKRSHWAWYIFPTYKPGMSEPLPQTFVRDNERHLFLALAETGWKECLELLAKLVGEKGLSVLPSIDHGRVRYFCSFWSFEDTPPWLDRVISSFLLADANPSVDHTVLLKKMLDEKKLGSVGDSMEATGGYPKTFHLPFSPCVFADDVQHTEMSYLESKEIVITEKLDGGNCCIAPSEQKVFARTHGHEATHPSFGPVKELAQTLFYDPGFPPNLKLFGECMFGIHSIEYDQLKSFFYLFGVLENNRWWSWDEVEGLAKEHHLLLPPVIFRGRTTMKDVQLLLDERSRKLSALSTSQKPEGFVIRQVDGFHSSEFSKSIAKYVRPNHVQTGADWRRTWQKASLKRD